MAKTSKSDSSLVPFLWFRRRTLTGGECKRIVPSQIEPTPIRLCSDAPQYHQGDLRRSILQASEPLLAYSRVSRDL